MAGPFLTRDSELLVKVESAWGTDPTLAGTDAFAHKVLAGFGFGRVQARFDRDKDRAPAVAVEVEASGGLGGGRTERPQARGHRLA